MPTKIEWCDEVWNPVSGCTPISEGCAHCYAKRMSKRLAGRCGYPADDPFKVTFHPDKFLGDNWKDGCRVFVGSMCDLFHENINFRGPEMRRIFGTMTDFPRVFFILLTKRPQRMKDAMEDLFLRDGEAIPTNLFLGVSCENQARADERIPILLQIPAAVHWVSHEPGLGLITYPKEFLALGNRAWVATGGETGQGARPMHPDIPRHDRDQCQAAGVPFYFKSWGKYIRRNGDFHPVIKGFPKSLLDGREWREMPEAVR